MHDKEHLWNCNYLLSSENHASYLFSGIHHLYLGRHFWGVLYMLSLGICGIGWITDLWRIPGIVDETNKYMKRRDSTRPIYVMDCYILLACPITGILGVQHYMLGRVVIGLFYTCTLGGLMIGWLLDVCRMAALVKEHNRKVKFK